MNWSDCYSSERRNRYAADSGVVQCVLLDLLFWGAIIALYAVVQ